MELSTLVEKDDTFLVKILRALEKLREDRVIEGIQCRHYTVYDIEQMTEELKIFQHRVNIESRALSKFSENFIGQYATNNNTCFTTAELMFNRMKSTLASLKSVFKDTSRISRRRLPEGVDAPTVFDVSSLGQSTVQLDAFGLDSFPDQVHEFYHTIETLFSSATTTIALCHRLIAQEEETREDKVRLRQIYDKSCNELMDGVRAFSQFIGPDQELPKSEMEERRMKAKSEDAFIKDEYHRHNKQEMTNFVVVRTLKEARNEGMTGLEPLFWKGNPDKAFKVRRIIERLDKLNGVEGQKGSLSSMVLVEFLKWCNVNESLEKKLYEEHFRPNYILKGKYKVLGWNTISGKRKELKDMGDTDEKLARDFEKRMKESGLTDNAEADSRDEEIQGDLFLAS